MGKKGKLSRYFEASLAIAMGIIGLLAVPFIFMMSRIKMFH
jgi:hypothetical protein